MGGGEAEHCFERDVPIKSTIVSKDELIEVRIDVLAAQAVIRAQRPTLYQRECAMAPGQDDIGCHGAYDTGIVPIFSRQSRIGRVAIREQRRARLDIGPHEGFERLCRVVGDHREAQSTRARIDVFRAASP